MARAARVAAGAEALQTTGGVPLKGSRGLTVIFVIVREAKTGIPWASWRGASMSSDSRNGETAYVLMATGGALFVVALAAIVFGLRRPPAAASLEAALPTPQTWAVVVAARTAETGPPASAEFRAVTLDVPRHGSAGDSIDIVVPVAKRDCADLEARVGGRCGDPGDPHEDPENVSVQSLGRPLQGNLRLDGEGDLEFMQAGTTGSAQPIEWRLVPHAPSTLAIDCESGDRLLFSGPRGSFAATCARFEAEFSIRASIEPQSGARFQFSGVHWLKSRVLGRAVFAIVDQGELILDGKSEPLSPTEPKSVAIAARLPHLVSFDVRAPRAEAAPHLSIRTDRAAVLSGDHRQLPTWIERHSALTYVFFGSLLGLFLTALSNFLAARRHK